MSRADVIRNHNDIRNFINWPVVYKGQNNYMAFADYNVYKRVFDSHWFKVYRSYKFN